MANLFFDTSALCKHYHAETGTAKVDALLSDPANRCYISRLVYIEMHSVFAMNVRTGKISLNLFHTFLSHFYSDVQASHLFKTLRLKTTHLREAQSLLIAHAPYRQLRTLDSLQLAFALQLSNRIGSTSIVSADIRLNLVAQHMGFTVINPIVP